MENTMSKMTKRNLISLAMVRDSMLAYAMNNFYGARVIDVDEEMRELTRNFIMYEIMVEREESHLFTKRAYELMRKVCSSRD